MPRGTHALRAFESRVLPPRLGRVVRSQVPGCWRVSGFLEHRLGRPRANRKDRHILSLRYRAWEATRPTTSDLAGVRAEHVAGIHINAVKTGIWWDVLPTTPRFVLQTARV